MVEWVIEDGLEYGSNCATRKKWRLTLGKMAGQDFCEAIFYMIDYRLSFEAHR